MWNRLSMEPLQQQDAQFKWCLLVLSATYIRVELCLPNPIPHFSLTTIKALLFCCHCCALMQPQFAHVWPLSMWANKSTWHSSHLAIPSFLSSLLPSSLLGELHLLSLPLDLLPLLNHEYQSSCPCLSTTSVQDKSMWCPFWLYLSFPPSPSSLPLVCLLHRVVLSWPSHMGTDVCPLLYLCLSLLFHSLTWCRVFSDAHVLYVLPTLLNPFIQNS